MDTIDGQLWGERMWEVELMQSNLRDKIGTEIYERQTENIDRGMSGERKLY